MNTLCWMKLLKELRHKLSIAVWSIKHCTKKGFGNLIKHAAYKQLKATAKLHFSGGVSGALNDENDPTFQKRKEHAQRYYEEVRKRNCENEISTISKNSNLSEKIVRKAYEHIFINKHKLEEGYMHFFPDFDMAQSWQRLREGANIQKHDIVLLQHEALEASYMEQGYSYNKAHIKTCEMGYNYQAELDRWSQS